MSVDVKDWAGRPHHDGDVGHRLGNLAIRKKLKRDRIARLELTDAEKALLRSVGDPVYGTCPACNERDVELVIRNGRESCGKCPWQRGREVEVAS